MIYADYAYYTDTFYGEMLTDEDVFTKFAARASDYIDRITMNRARDYVVLHPDDENIKKACCAAAEQYYMLSGIRAGIASEDGEIASESVGSHSVSYRSGFETAASLEADLRKIVSAYLALTGLLYRGIPYENAAHCYGHSC